MRRLGCLLAAALVLLASLAGNSNARAAEPESAAEFLPATTVAYVEIAGPNELISLVLDHPLKAKVEQLDQYQAALKSDEYRQFRRGQALVESLLKMDSRTAVEKLTEGGIYFAFDPNTDGAAVLVKASDEATLVKIRNTFLMLARQDARDKGNDDPIEEQTYRDVKVYKVGGGGFGTLGQWLVATNKGELGKAVIDAMLDGSASSLAGNENFAAARKSIQGEPSVWGYLDVGTIRASGEAEDVFTGQADDPGGELLLGGILANLKETPYATLSVYLNQTQARANVSLPHDFAWVSEARVHYFGPEGKGAAPPLLEAKETIASVSIYRDFSSMWLRAGDLFDDATLDQLAEADNGLTTLFSGKDFGEEILGAIQPEVQFVVTRQDLADAKITPAIKLPAFAGVAQLREPETMQRELKRIFQSLVGFYNVVGAMNALPPLDLGIEQDGEATLHTATYAPDEDEDYDNAKIYFNFTPTLAFAGEQMILASTTDLARELAAMPASEPLADGAPNTNANMAFHADSLAKALADNREHLIAQNMLEEGHGREEAEHQISILMTIVELFEGASLKLQTTADTLSLDAEVNLKE